MTEKQLNNIVKAIKEVPEGNDEMARALLLAAADSISIDKVKSLIDGKPTIEQQENGNSVVKFTAKEIMLMPKTFRKEFRVQGCTAHVRKRNDGRYNCSYEIRYYRNGYRVSASATSLEEAKKKFIEKLNNAQPVDKTKEPIPGTFTEFTLNFFEKYRKRQIKENTYKNDLYRFNNHLKPYFKSTPLRDITSDMVQDFVDGYVEKGQMKSAKELRSLLSVIFTNAVDRGVLRLNPCKLVIVQSYESEHGKALTIEEEDLLIERLKDNPKYLVPLAVALYTGLRPCEYRTAYIDGDFITSEDKKQHTNKTIYKHIPITKRLKPILKGVDKLYFPDKKYLRDNLVAILPNHTLYDLRTTFDTRCEMFYVSDLARQMWMGHGVAKLRRTYADMPKEWFLKEAEKLDY